MPYLIYYFILILSYIIFEKFVKKRPGKYLLEKHEYAILAVP